MAEIKDSMVQCEFCQQPAVLPCTTCRRVFYCCESHMREDRISHRANCVVSKVWRTCVTPEGYQVTALRDIQKGDLVMTETPFVTGQLNFRPYLSPPLRPSCVGCYKVLNPDVPSFCPNCRWPICGDNCSGLLDVNYHAEECLLLKVLFQTEKFRPWFVVFPLRCLLLKKINPRDWIFLQEMAFYANIKIIDRTRNDALVRRAMPMLEFLHSIAENVLLDVSFETVKQVFAVLDVYTINWSPGDDVELGSLYPTISFLQHNCVANTRFYLGNPRFHESVALRRGHRKAGLITVQAIRDISKGEVLTLSRTVVVFPTIARQAKLFNARNPQCFCERCLDPRELDSDFGTLKCSDCSGWVLPINTKQITKSDWKCQKCQLILSSTEIRKRHDHFSKEFFFLEENLSVEHLESLLTKFEENFHPNHFFCFELKLKLLKACGSLKDGLYGMCDHDLHTIAEQCRNIRDVRKKIGPFMELEEMVDFAECSTHYAGIGMELMRRGSYQEYWNADRIMCSIEEPCFLLKEAVGVFKNEPRPLNAKQVNLSSRMETALSLINGYTKQLLAKNYVPLI